MRPKSILVTDDDEQHRDILVTLLKHHGYSVTEAGDGADALDQVRRDPPDLIIMDLQLPKMDGLQATRRIKEDLTTSAIPIIIFSARVMERDRLSSDMAGCDLFLEKPAEPSRVLEAVQKWIGPPC